MNSFIEASFSNAEEEIVEHEIAEALTALNCIDRGKAKLTIMHIIQPFHNNSFSVIDCNDIAECVQLMEVAMTTNKGSTIFARLPVDTTNPSDEYFFYGVQTEDLHRVLVEMVPKPPAKKGKREYFEIPSYGIRTKFTKGPAEIFHCGQHLELSKSNLGPINVVIVAFLRCSKPNFYLLLMEVGDFERCIVQHGGKGKCVI